jgi:3-hydroxyacyl-[acyl-carrier-protein] dehydratase
MEFVDCSKIMELLPHRYPFLLIDRVEDIVLGEKARGLKHITLNEYVFQGHFPEEPIFPGVLILESMAQTAAVLALLSIGASAGGGVGDGEGESADNGVKHKSVYFMTIDNAKFRKPVRPGDSMALHVNKEQMRGNIWKFRGEAKVRDELVAEADFMAMLNKD